MKVRVKTLEEMRKLYPYFKDDVHCSQQISGGVFAIGMLDYLGQDIDVEKYDVPLYSYKQTQPHKNGMRYAWHRNWVVHIDDHELHKQAHVELASTSVCQHTRKYINKAMHARFWVCPDCKADLGDA